MEEEMKSLNSKRRKAMKKFFNGVDRVALGLFDRDWKRNRWKEEQERTAIANVVKAIKPCSSCGKMPILEYEANFEYPEGAIIKCDCGMRTRGYVEFISLDPRKEFKDTYSKLES
ncbi:unnamed protein product, partial [marine sediment metagenome]